MSFRARFRFVNEVSSDTKTTVIKVKTLQLLDNDETYIFPPELQHSSSHPELCGLPIVKSALKQLTKRNQYRQIRITLPIEIASLYFDTENNVCFKNNYLEEYDSEYDTAPQSSFTAAKSSNNTPAAVTQKKSLHSLAKDMVLEKFTGKNQNIVSWLNIFESECKRLEIGIGKYSEILRLFLEESGIDWYSLSLKVMSLNDPWDTWKKSMIEAFGDRGWSDISYAFSYRYLTGTLNEYTLKKLNLLLDVEPTMSVKTRICLVALGLPPFIRDRLHQKNIETQNALISEINQLESLIKPKSNKSVNPGNPSVPKNINPRKNTYKPCSICEKMGYPGRYHLEATCWNNPGNKPQNKNERYEKNDKNSNKNVKLANNAVLEEELNTERNQKN